MADSALSWNKFVVENSSPSSFLQSWEWGEFQRALGHRVQRLKIKDLLQAQVVIRELPAGRSYLEVAKGPILATGDPPAGEAGWRLAIEEFERKIREMGSGEKATLARINPPYERGRLDLSEVWRKPAILVRQLEPENTVLVDLTKSEDELLQHMHEKSRYNLRLAAKKGAKVEIATDSDKAFEQFLGLLEETAKRDGIVSWPRERFRKFREIFMSPPHLSSPTEGGGSPSRNFPPPGGEELPARSAGGKEGGSPRAELLIGSLNGRVLAGAIVMLFGDSGTYLYAASSALERNANVPSLVLWEAIKLAKARGKRWYDMWGVAPANEPNHPWAGITRFKTRYVKPGETGKEITGTGARDLVLDKTFYSLFRVYKLFHG